MTINQPGQHRHARKIYKLGSGRNGHGFPDCLNLVVVDKNDLIGQHGSRVGINEPSSLDRSDLAESRY